MANSLVPYSFVPGTKAMASEVNANFIALASGVEDAKQFTQESIEKFSTDMEARLDEAIGNKVERNLSNSVNISNCLLEVPQRIKYELTDGTLTIKAGSELTLPDGSYCTLENDYVASSLGAAATYKFIGMDVSTGAFYAYTRGQNVYSGDTAPSVSSQYCLWLDTANKVIKLTSDTGVTWVEQPNMCLPIMLAEVTSSGVAQIHNLFNSIGYIGSTFWIDTGVKGLIPDGRNMDGTLQNLEFNTTELIYVSRNINGSVGLFYTPTNSGFISSGWIYDAVENKWNYGSACKIAICELKNGVIEGFIPNYSFRSVDYNEFIGGIGSAKAYITATYTSGASWYRVWSDGWKEQGGVTSAVAIQSNVTVTFLKSFSNTNYTILSGIKGSNGAYSPVFGIHTFSTTGFSASLGRVENSGGTACLSWYCCGY